MCFGSVVRGTGGAGDNVGFVHLPVQIPKTFSHQAPKIIQVKFRFHAADDADADIDDRVSDDNDDDPDSKQAYSFGKKTS